jgi:cytidine deaminase
VNAEDAKLITLARGARGRVGAEHGAAVRDDTGRTYSGADVVLPSLQLSALQLAIAQAVAAGARGIEGAAVVAVDPRVTRADRAALHEAGGTDVVVILADPSGKVHEGTA